ncbi:hypothetical protein BX616_011077 [Lobosporangium transversale]|nr:hypothetical protein BX616_011077 [Lobosporangium transversale]
MTQHRNFTAVFAYILASVAYRVHNSVSEPRLANCFQKTYSPVTVPAFYIDAVGTPVEIAIDIPHIVNP